MNPLYEYLYDALPTDHSRQCSSTQLLKKWISDKDILSVLDLGCGVGDTVELFNKLKPSAKWTGVDIEDSPEVSSRIRTGDNFVTYDGVNLPFPDGEFDLVYSHQVFEHVRYPEKVLAETYRTLKPGGTFLGSTSQLEPYHSFSIFNYTIYGFARILEDSGLKLLEIRPGIDAITLINRNKSKDRKVYNRYFVEESPGNIEIEAAHPNRGHRFLNFSKLRWCGQFTFRAVKP